MAILFNCDYCGGDGKDYPSHYIRKKLHFCKRKCYASYIREVEKPEDHNAWQGGVSQSESNKRWREKNKAKANAVARARKLREMNAPGSHTEEDWTSIKKKHQNICAEYDEKCDGSITKDHIIPLAMGGSNYPSNLQPLCRYHNAKKNRRVYLGNLGSSL